MNPNPSLGTRQTVVETNRWKLYVILSDLYEIVRVFRQMLKFKINHTFKLLDLIIDQRSILPVPRMATVQNRLLIKLKS